MSCGCKVHDGLVLDDVRDLEFVTNNQHCLQGKYDAAVEFASTAGGTCAYQKYALRAKARGRGLEAHRMQDLARVRAHMGKLWMPTKPKPWPPSRPTLR